MKIAHLGYVANVAYFLCWAMNKYYGYEGVVYQPNKPINLATQKVIYGYESGNPLKVDLIYYDVSSKIKRDLDILLLQKDDFDVIHLHEGGYFSGSLMAKMSGAKVIRHYHGSDLRKSSNKPLKALLRACYKLLGEDRILVSTVDLLNYVHGSNAKKRAELLPNPVDPLIQKCRNDKEEAIVFLPTRHDELDKKTSIAFKAWKKLRKLNREAILVTIEWGRNYHVFKNIFKNDKNVRWLPPLNRVEYVSMLERSAVVWGQFHLRMLGLSELEAFAARKPLSAYIDYDSYPGLPPSTLLGSPSPIEMASETALLLKDPDRRRAESLKFHEWVMKRHGAKNIARSLNQIYKNL